MTINSPKEVLNGTSTKSDLHDLEEELSIPRHRFVGEVDLPERMSISALKAVTIFTLLY
jgi:hypothetical protein